MMAVHRVMLRCWAPIFMLWSFAEGSMQVRLTVEKHSFQSNQDVRQAGDQLTYKVVNEHNETLFQGGDLAVSTDGYWCVAPSSTLPKTSSNLPVASLVLSEKRTVSGFSSVLGKYEGVQIEWKCRMPRTERRVITSFLNFDSRKAVLFDIEFPDGLSSNKDNDETATLATFPSFLMQDSSNSTASKSSQKNSKVDQYFPPLLPSVLSWEGSFVQSVRRLSVGQRGGPTVFYNASDPSLERVIVSSPYFPSFLDHTSSSRSVLKFRFNQFTAGSNKDWTGKVPSFSPGLSGRLKRIGPGVSQTILLYEGSNGGITDTIHEWGTIMQKSMAEKEPFFPMLKKSDGLRGNHNVTQGYYKIKDLTLEKIGYQTDNGAMYCFCRESNCSDTLIREKEYLDSIGVSIGYLSFQGAGTSSGRGKAAPWCIERWSADGGQNPNQYPMDTGDFQKALGVPLQLYAPYFCPNATTYFKPHTPWKSVTSNPTLPQCKDFAFDTVNARDSKEFFHWFLTKGIKAGMTSFESDFMDQNVNCVDAFVEEEFGADGFLSGMAAAALDLGIPVQWCYASPNVVLSSLAFPAVTNFRVSFDYCYGHSYEIGESSLLVWAVGAAPSKDTLWTTDNNKTETPGCDWTLDHEGVAAELHVVLAIMSTGPVGISDGIGMTNVALLDRIISKDGSLLQPSKPITAVDSSFLHHSGLDGYLYGTHALGPSWIFVSFQLQTPFQVTLRDFWPRVTSTSSFLVYRSFSSSHECIDGEDAFTSDCVSKVVLDHKPMNGIAFNLSQTVFVAPSSSFDSPGSDLSPNMVTVWQECPQSGIVFLGEVDKYVALSPKRFLSVMCTEAGVEAQILGSKDEVIKLTLLVPRLNSYEVVIKTITLGAKGHTFRYDSRRTSIITNGKSKL